MEDDKKLNEMRISVKLCMDLYDFFSKNTYRYDKRGGSLAGLSCYLSIKNKTWIQFSFIEYLLKEIMNNNVIHLHNRNHQYEGNTIDRVTLIILNRSLAESSVETLIANKKKFPNNFIINIEEKNSKFFLCCYKLALVKKDDLSDISIVNLFHKYYDFNYSSIYKLYYYIKDTVGIEFCKDVKINYERNFSILVPPLETLIGEMDEDNKRKSTKEVIKITIKILNLFRYLDSLGGEDALIQLSYFISVFCKGYINETFICYIIRELENRRLIYININNDFGTKTYDFSCRLSHLSEKNRLSEYILNNINTLVEEIFPNCPEVYKETISYPYLYDTIRLITYIMSYNNGRLDNCVEFYKKISLLYSITYISNEDMEDFKSIVYSMMNNSSLTDNIWDYYKEKYMYYNNTMIFLSQTNRQHIIGEIKGRNKLYKKLLLSKDQEILNRIIEIDKVYMYAFLELLNEDIDFQNLHLKIERTNIKLNPPKCNLICTQLSASLSNEKLERIKERNFLKDKGFKSIKRNIYNYLIFNDIYIETNIFFKGDLYEAKAFLEDNHVKVINSDLRSDFFKCHIKLDDYEKLKTCKRSKFTEDEFGNCINIILN